MKKNIELELRKCSDDKVRNRGQPCFMIIEWLFYWLYTYEPIIQNAEEESKSQNHRITEL